MSLRLLLAVAGIILVLAAGFVAYLATQEPGPMVVINGPTVIGGGVLDLDLTAELPRGDLSTLAVSLEQAGQSLPLVDLGATRGVTLDQETPERVRIRAKIPTASLPALRDGQARLVVTSTRPVLFGLRQARSTTTREVGVHISPPVLSVVSKGHVISLGGAELVIYRVEPANSESGVLVGDRFYRGVSATGLLATADPALHVAFFAVPIDADTTVPVRLTARDAVGNRVLADFEHEVRTAGFTYTTIPVDDRFFAQFVPPILAASGGPSMPTGSPAERREAFLVLNRDVRRANAEHLEQLGAGSAPEWLAGGPFKRLPGTSTEAPFAEHRTYVLDGEEIDQQLHLGVDLASTRRAPVLASNAGRVAWASYLGIYGNSVVIDHGLGVQSLYAHMTRMDVEQGDRVTRGETIGTSGATGLAGGDHVHFVVLVGGTPVNPLEWWDPHWYADRIDRKLRAAGLI